MGPPPKPPGTRQRRNATVSTMRLSAAGRKGKCPPWPLPDDIQSAVLLELLEAKIEMLQEKRETCSPRSRAKVERDLDAAMMKATVLDRQITAQRESEVALWTELWSTPQAEAWEKLGWLRDVAQYVRHKVRGEMGSLDDAKEARQWSDRLGLNPLAMLRLRWEMERTDEAEHRGRQRRERPTPAKKASGDPRRALSAVK